MPSFISSVDFLNGAWDKLVDLLVEEKMPEKRGVKRRLSGDTSAVFL
jgi:hypothetical protein